MKKAILLVLLLPAVVAAGCGGGGGGSSKLNSDDVAVVDSQHISKASLDELMSEAKANYKLQGQTFPKAGTTEYTAVKSRAVVYLVQQAEQVIEAGKLGITVTDKDVDGQLKQIKKSCCNGNETKYKSELKQQGLTDKEVRDTARANLVGQRLGTKITKDVTVAPTAIEAYYIQHQADFQTPASRAMHYILLGKNKASLAQSLFHQLDGAPDSKWCTLAKKYSKDSSTASTCGKATFQKGQTVPEFDKLAFSLKTKKVATVNSKQYGWFVLQPTADVTPAKKTGVEAAGKQIKAQLLATKKQQAITDWTNKTTKTYCKGLITYQAGYEPVAAQDPCQQTTSTNATTT